MNRPPNNLSNLTQSQLLLWTGQQLNQNVPLYNVVFTFEFDGEINVSHFQNAFNILVDKSDAMRTVLSTIEDIPQRNVHDSISSDVEILDFSNDNKPIEKFGNWIDERMKKNFDLSKCLFDSVLIKISTEKYIWYFNQHHLICDAWSVSVQYKLFTEIYGRLESGENANDFQVSQFQDYVGYEKTNRLKLRDSSVDTYWEEKLKSIPKPPKLYGKSVHKKTTFSKRISIDIGKKKTEKLFEIAKEKDVRLLTSQLTLFNIFATVLFSYLYRISNEQKIAIGTPTHNRFTNNFKNTPGLFIEFFPFLVDVKTEDTFLTLYNRLKNETNNFLKNAKPGASSAKLNGSFNVILNYINTDFPDFNGIPCEAIWRHPNHSDESHDLRLHIYNDVNAKSIKLYFDLNLAVFSEEILETAPKHFIKLLEAFIDNRTQSITKSSLLAETEFEDIIVGFNKRTKVANKNVLELFQIQVQQNPAKTAVSDKKQTLSFVDLDEKSNQLANYLVAKEITNGERVAIYLNRSADLIIAILGALKAGCVYVPIASGNPFKRVSQKIEESKAAIVITSQYLSENLKEFETPIFQIDAGLQRLKEYEKRNPNKPISQKELAYIMFTSGSTGTPKGVSISHQALANYINFAGKKYGETGNPKFPLFTTIDFDLTVTSIFVPLTIGGSIVVYEEGENGPDLAVLDVIEDNNVDIIKLTPSHLDLIKLQDLGESQIKTIIVGGEDFRRDLAIEITNSFSEDVTIYNEYGPTEATVGCILNRFDPNSTSSRSVPIGKPFANTQVYILDGHLNPVPKGVTGKLFLSGESLSDGYWNNRKLTKKKFLSSPFQSKTKMYDTGDFARLNSNGEVEYGGRKDRQVKIGGIRIEIGEIESELAKHTDIRNCVVKLVENKKQISTDLFINCIRCGLPSNYPTAKFDEHGVCDLCRSFESYQRRVKKYFKTPDDLKKIFNKSKPVQDRKYDCLMLLSGGKDSTYALAQLVEMGVEVLAFTLENGYISEGAKANIRRVVNDLGVDHIFGKTSAMNAIFVDSLERYSNVCNGCFKTIYTLSTKVAFEKNIPFIVTGLSRGQFFETRLTEELFWKDDVEKIDKTILEARKAYHRVDDAAKRFLDTSIFSEDSIFEKVRFIDFYRYFDVEYEEMMNYLDNHLPWIRPIDTGRSTNCLINQVGIYVHKKKEGYSNYAFPYSWDVRIGHKKRDVSLAEINEEIDERQVHKIMREIGYQHIPGEALDEKSLVGFYESSKEIPRIDLVNFLSKTVPFYMIPSHFERLDSMPLTENGKIDQNALRDLSKGHSNVPTTFVSPENDIEEMLVSIWTEILRVGRIGTLDNFIELGGDSLAAIKIMTRANDAFNLDLPLHKIFEFPTVARLSESIEQTILKKLEELGA